MKKTVAIMIALLLCLIAPVPAVAAVNDEAVIDPSRSCRIEIEYRDTVQNKDPIPDAAFTAYRIAIINAQGGYESLIPGVEQVSPGTKAADIRQKVRKAYQKPVPGGVKYTAVTDTSGQAVFSKMEQGVYLVEESRAAKEHLASVPFLAAVPYTEGNAWVYELAATPKPIRTEEPTTVTEKSPPVTGDDQPMLLFGGITVGSFLLLAFLLVLLMRRESEKEQ